ncbi:glycosyltransferase family 2 protein [Membranihabitans marinus]|uniref:glycosyltransferase family 2 protein n=1 Tax=Membranihabitans marinus TaxID=1227546 RepID=UPI001F29E138|nr:glycosyltransferase family 2 protein [Membranihabitans marinus]
MRADGGNLTLAIVVSYNGEQYIEACISSLLDMEGCDVLVVDNHSTDRTLSILQTFGKDIELLSNVENLGFGQANNQGLRYARDNAYEAVLLVNQDTVSTPTMLTGLRQTSLQYPDIGVLSPMHYSDGETLDVYFESYIRRALDENRYYRDHHHLLLVQFVNAAFWYLPMATIRRVGGFDPLFFLYGEDNDYIHRLHHAGLSVVVNTSVKGYHLDRHSRQKVESPQDYERYFMVGLKNVNDGWIKAVLKFGYDVVKVLIGSLRRGQVKEIRYLCIAVTRMMVKYPRIYRSRKQKGEFQYLD